MKIQIVSDLHLEFADCNIKNENNADVLILSGDILVAQDLHDHPESDYGMYSDVNLANLGRRQRTALRFRDFLKRCSFQFPKVLYIAGNHEFYHGKFPESIEHLRAECAKFPNVHFLEMDTITIDDVTFIGGTLWTDMNRGDPLTVHAISDMMNDFRVIRNDEHGYTKLRPAHAMDRYRKTVEYIKQMVDANGDRKCVVVGHHAPSFQSIGEQYKHDTLMNGGYASDLSEFIMDRPQIKLWTHGHMHQTFDYMIGETRVVCNPRGYESHGEVSGWDPSILIEI
jgi:Icc-related predicted phosphoesterase